MTENDNETEIEMRCGLSPVGCHNCRRATCPIKARVFGLHDTMAKITGRNSQLETENANLKKGMQDENAARNKAEERIISLLELFEDKELTKRVYTEFGWKYEESTEEPAKVPPEGQNQGQDAQKTPPDEPKGAQ